LFISGTLDGRTPVSNAETVRKGFPNGTHLNRRRRVAQRPAVFIFAENQRRDAGIYARRAGFDDANYA